ncbi:MAG: hypothetical protein QN120_14415 [Armatimonadota bacterium]|nr:hypothetical protein [Armatimonadota bacterium]
MQDEFARVPEFIDWYRDKRQQMQSDALMSAMKTIRDANLHRAPVRPTMQVRVPVGDNAVIIDHMEFETPRADGTKQIAEPAETVLASRGVQMRWIIDGINDRDIIGACAEYLAKLEAIVKEYEERFVRSVGSDDHERGPDGSPK